MSTDRDTAVETLAAEILRYLQSHRRAADSVDGIAQWWIKQQRLEETLEQVQAALDRLVEEQLVEAKEGGSGRKVYALVERRASSTDGSGDTA
jgi:hypothetical protein